MIDFPSLASINMAVVFPAMSLAVGAVILLLIELVLPPKQKYLVPWLALLGILISLAATLFTYNTEGDAFGGMFVADPFTSFVNVVVLVAAGLGILLAINYLKRTEIEHRTDYYLLLLFTTSGMLFMAGANDLIMIFVALELLSIPLYVLSGIRRPDTHSEEAALKYLLLGAFASGFLVYGTALIYGAVGSTNLPQVWMGAVAIIEAQSPSMVLLLLGVGMITVAFGFKVAAVPFHMWTPDVYEGAPTPVTAFMSVGTKAASFAGLLRILMIGLPALIIAEATAAAWVDSIAIIAALTMVLGNFVALRQTNIKRMLAYSSIAHAGYILMAVAAAGHPNVGDQGVRGALIYLLTYAFTNLGAFGVVIAMERNDGTGLELDDYDGLAKQRPGLALVMAFFMLSLTGIPLTGGFIGKFFVFAASVNAGLYWLAIIGVLTSVVGAFYYVRLIVKMFMQEGDATPTQAMMPVSLGVAIGVAAVGTLAIGVLPWIAANMAQGIAIAQPIVAALGGG